MLCFDAFKTSGNEAVFCVRSWRLRKERGTVVDLQRTLMKECTLGQEIIGSHFPPKGRDFKFSHISIYNISETKEWLADT